MVTLPYTENTNLKVDRLLKHVIKVSIEAWFISM